MGPRQYDNAGGPLIMIVVLVALVLLCRWVFSTSDRDRRAARARAAAASRGDFGLLVPVATVGTPADAEAMRAALAARGVRATVSRGSGEQERVVLVFRQDEALARTVVS